MSPDTVCECGHTLSTHLGGEQGGECLRRGCRCPGAYFNEMELLSPAFRVRIERAPAPTGLSYLGPCWLWIGYLDRDGYGRLGRQQAHRRAYEIVVGDIPSALTIDHLCRVRRCVNPRHLEAVTRRENTQRAHREPVTHCVHGHEYTPANTYITPGGCRACRTCIRGRVRRYSERKSAA